MEVADTRRQAAGMRIRSSSLRRLLSDVLEVELLLPVVVVRTTEDQLQLFGAIVVGLEQRGNRGPDFGPAGIVAGRPFSAAEAVEGSSHLEQLGTDGQEFLVEYGGGCASFLHTHAPIEQRLITTICSS